MKKVITLLLILFVSVGSFSCSNKQNRKTVKILTYGKPTVLIFDRTTCPYCKKLHKDLTTNKNLLKLEKSFTIYFIHVNENNTYILPTKDGNIKLSSDDLATTFGFRGSTPFVVFTDEHLRPIVTIPGYLKPKTLSKVFEFVLSKAYKTMSLEEYISTP